MPSAPLWSPHPERQQQTAMHAFLQRVQADHPEVHDYASLHKWSVTQYQAFWQTYLAASGLLYEGDSEPVLTDARMPGPGFFPKVRLNFAENLLRRRDDAIAVVSLSESRPAVRLSFAELHREVQRVRTALQVLGVRTGDRVAGFIPNIAEAVIAMLATTSLGAIWSSCSPDFGVQGALDRFGQIKPKVLFTANAYTYQGKSFDCLAKCRDMVNAISSVQALVVISLLSDAPQVINLGRAPCIPWDDLPTGPKTAWQRFPFNQPLYILYSSGTTGIPKCIVHGAGGTLLQHMKELSLHADLRRDDNMMYFTTCGWMMWNWMASSLAMEARITLFDGAPTHPHMGHLWDVADAEKVTHFGTSAKYLASCRGKISPRDNHDFAAMRVIMSTGSPLHSEEFDWVYQHVKGDVQLSSISGGTDIISCFIIGNPLLPVYRNEIQCVGLGMDVAAYNEQQQPVVGEKGELVCRKPFPSMPVGFWDDAERAKYTKAYFDKIPGVWCHGDYLAFTGSQGDVGGIVMYGRSDATLKPGGVRIGTAEIYRLVESLAEVEDSVVIGQPYQGDVRVVLFVKVRAPHVFDQALVDRIKTTIRNGATPRHVPAVILPVSAIPYTRSGKKMELAVLDVVNGTEPKNTEAMQDTNALESYRNCAELKG